MKKSYEKPEVVKVELASEEAVLSNCKAVPAAPPNPDGCLRPDGQVVPATIGS